MKIQFGKPVVIEPLDENYAVEEKAKASGELTEELKNWIQWAQNKTDWYDPFLEHPDPDLEVVDKETLTFKKSNQWF